MVDLKPLKKAFRNVFGRKTQEAEKAAHLERLKKRKAEVRERLEETGPDRTKRFEAPEGSTEELPAETGAAPAEGAEKDLKGEEVREAERPASETGQKSLDALLEVKRRKKKRG